MRVQARLALELEPMQREVAAAQQEVDRVREAMNAEISKVKGNNEQLHSSLKELQALVCLIHLLVQSFCCFHLLSSISVSQSLLFCNLFFFHCLS
jgi:cbb3-type cytochrome oxidase cytochrome c subunit